MTRLADKNEARLSQHPRTIHIEKAPCELYKILKFENLVQSGGEAKYMIAQGCVRVNGAIETRKRKKIVSGDLIAFEGQTYRITDSRRPVT